MLNGLESPILSILSPSSHPTPGASAVVELEVEHALTRRQTGGVDAVVALQVDGAIHRQNGDVVDEAAGSGIGKKG